MFQSQFIFQNLHFAVNLLAAFVFFSISWLYFDAWRTRRNFRDGLKLVGYLLFSVAYVLESVRIESTILPHSPFSLETVLLAGIFIKIAGALLVIIGLLLEPLQKRPVLTAAPAILALSLPYGFSVIHYSMFFSALLTVVIALLYLRQAFWGLEYHLRAVGFGFIVLALSDFSSLGRLFQSTDNTYVYNFVAAFGPLWIFEHLALLLAIIILGKWVFYYLLKRIQVQLLIIFPSAVLLIFIITTLVFTTILLFKFQGEVLRQLDTDVKVLQYAIEGKQAETLSDAQMVAQSPQIQKAISDNDTKSLAALTSSILLTKKQAFLTIVSPDGVILMRADDPERVGGSMSDDTLVKRSLLGQEVSSVMTKEGVLAPDVSIRSSVPIKSNDKIIGAVISGVAVDNAFVDGVKQSTGLNAAIYANNIRSATTFLGLDGKSRWVGVTEDNAQVKEQVLNKGTTYIGQLDILNTSYYAAFAPLKDIDSNPVGMLLVAREQSGLMQTAGETIELTFLITVVMIIISVIPTYLVAQYLMYQMR